MGFTLTADVEALSEQLSVEFSFVPEGQTKPFRRGPFR